MCDTAAMLRIPASLLLLAAMAVVAGCAAPSDGEEEGAVEGEESAFTGTADREIGQLFMIEHFGVEPGGYADVSSMIKNKNLGSIIHPAQRRKSSSRSTAASRSDEPSPSARHLNFLWHSLQVAFMSPSAFDAPAASLPSAALPSATAVPLRRSAN